MVVMFAMILVMAFPMVIMLMAVTIMIVVVEVTAVQGQCSDEQCGHAPSSPHRHTPLVYSSHGISFLQNQKNTIRRRANVAPT